MSYASDVNDPAASAPKADGEPTPAAAAAEPPADAVVVPEPPPTGAQKDQALPWVDRVRATIAGKLAARHLGPPTLAESVV